MIDFSTLKSLTIPEGEVKSIAVNGVIKWERQIRTIDLYQRVESITTKGGTSGGWILSDFIANNTSGLELTYSVPSFSDTATMGSRTSADNTRCYIFYPRTTTVGYIGWKTAQSWNVSTTANTKYTTRLNWLNSRKAVILNANGTQLASKSISGTQVQQVSPIGICRYNNATSTPSSGRAMTVFGVRMTQDSEIVRDFVPCYRKSDGEIGMLEMISEQFFPSKVSGGFTVGKDLEWDI